MTVSAADPTMQQSLRGHSKPITSLSFHPSNTRLATSSQSNTIIVYNLKTTTSRPTKLQDHTDLVYSLDYNTDGSLLASSSQDTTIRLWPTNTLGKPHLVKCHSKAVKSVRFNPQSDQFVTGSDDKTVKNWSTQTLKFISTFVGHSNWVTSVAIGPGNHSNNVGLIASGSDDKTVKIWDPRLKQCIHTFHTAGSVTGISFHQRENVLASSSKDGSINMWDLKTQKLIQHYTAAHDEGVNSVEFCGRDGKFMVSTGVDGTIKIWDTLQGHLFYTLNEHRGPTTTATFNSDGSLLATGATDAKIVLWKSNFNEYLKQISKNDGKSQVKAMEVIQDRKTSPNLKKSNSVTFEFDAKPDSVETEAARSIQKSKDDQLSDRQLNAAPSAIPNDPRTSESKPNTETITKRFQQTLNDLVKQMDILTETMSILEVLQSNKSRLTINEDRMDAIVKEISKISTSKRNPKISGQSEKSSKGMDSLLGHYE